MTCNTISRKIIITNFKGKIRQNIDTRKCWINHMV